MTGVSLWTLPLGIPAIYPWQTAVKAFVGLRDPALWYLLWDLRVSSCAFQLFASLFLLLSFNILTFLFYTSSVVGLPGTDIVLCNIGGGLNMTVQWR